MAGSHPSEKKTLSKVGLIKEGLRKIIKKT